MLYKIIAKKETEHNQLAERIEKNNSLDFANVSFVDQMTLVNLSMSLHNYILSQPLLLKNMVVQLLREMHNDDLVNPVKIGD